VWWSHVFAVAGSHPTGCEPPSLAPAAAAGAAGMGHPPRTTRSLKIGAKASRRRRPASTVAYGMTQDGASLNRAWLCCHPVGAIIIASTVLMAGYWASLGWYSVRDPTDGLPPGTWEQAALASGIAGTIGSLIGMVVGALIEAAILTLAILVGVMRILIVRIGADARWLLRGTSRHTGTLNHSTTQQR